MNVSSTAKRKTVSVKIPPWLHTIVSRTANEEGINQADAMGRMFQELYPGKSGTGDFLVEPTVEEKGVRVVAGAPQTPNASNSLKRSVEDLTNVKTINALSRDLGEGEGGEMNWMKEGMELRKIKAMFGGSENRGGGGGGASPEVTQLTQLIQRLEAQNQQLQQQMQNLQTTIHEKEADRLKETISAYEDRDKRAAEFSPLYERMDRLGSSIETMGQQIAEIRKTPTTTPEETSRKSEILTLATSIKDGFEAMAENIGKGQLGLGEVDLLITTIEKLKGLTPKDEGELSPTTMAISSISEVGKEIIREYGKIRRHEEEEDLSTGRKVPIKQRVIERQVLHYVNRAIDSGEGAIDAYAAASELGCTSEDVLIAVESLQKKGLIKYEKPRQTTPRRNEGREQRGEEVGTGTGRRLTEQQLKKLEADGVIVTE